MNAQAAVETADGKPIRLFEALFDSNLVCAVLLDRNFNFVRVNQAYATACQRELADFAGRNHFDVYPSSAKAIFDDVVGTKKAFSVKARPFQFPEDPPGVLTYWDWSLTPVFDDRGEVELLLFCLNEVTRQRQAEIDMRAMAERQRNLSRQLVENDEALRRHLARELHDVIGQELTVVKLLLENCAGDLRGPGGLSLRKALSTIDELTGRVRQISLNLRPPVLDDLGLFHALIGLIDMHRARTGLVISFKHSGIDGRLHPDTEIAAYRIVQEATYNIARHSGVLEADVAARGTSEAIMLRIEDRGRGFDWQSISARADSHGLRGMQERGRLLGGRVSIESTPGTGTTIIAELPLRRPTTGKDDGLA